MKKLIRGGTVVTMNPQRAILQADILIDGDRITAIGDLTGQAADEVINAAGRVVMPGLIQSHIHLAQTLFRGQADDLELLDWLRLRILPLEAAHDPDSVYYSALLGSGELLRGGTTAIVDMETVHHTESAFQALSESGIRAISGKVMIDTGPDVPAGLMQTTAVSIEESVRLLEKWDGHDRGRIRYGFCPRFVITCSDSLLREVAQLSHQHGLHVHTHASENKGEIAYVEANRGMRNVLYLDSVGLAHDRVVLAHCVHLDDAEMNVLAHKHVNVAHCPSSNLKLASGIAPIPELLRRGVNVSLGADGAACNNNLDAFAEMRLAALIQKPAHGPRAMPALQVLELATLGGAQAMGLAHEIGSLEVGKKADLAIVDLNGLHATPSGDLVSALVYAARATDVVLTMVDGRVVMRDGLLLTMDADWVQRGAGKAIVRLMQRIGATA